MKISQNNIDQIFSKTAGDYRPEVREDLWQRMEGRLPSEAPMLSVSNLLKIAAAVIFVVLSTTWMLQTTDSTQKVVDLTSESNTSYYLDYRDYIRSEGYASLKAKYRDMN